MPDISALITPISEDHPCGEDMSYSAEFDAIADARRADDPTLEQGDWVKDLKVADWEKVQSLCEQLLTEKTKDIRVCVWLTEAWARSEGFAGLASAYDLLAQLCATDWENLHPLPEDGDEEARINNMARLLELSEPLMKSQPVTQSQSGEFTIFELESAKHASRQHREDDDDDAESDNRLAQFESARRDTPRDFYASLIDDLDNCRDGLQHLEKILDERLGADGPSFGALGETLDEIYSLVRGYADDAGVSGKEEKSAQDEQAASAKPAAQDSGVSSKINNRAQALAQLRLVADYFRRTEPHSPVAYLADTAAHWGEMPLHSWLRNVIRDDNELAHVEELLGLANMQRGGFDDSRDDDNSGD